MKKVLREEVLEYILTNLPIFSFDLTQIDLEQIAKEFKIDTYNPEATQEEIVEHILENSK